MLTYSLVKHAITSPYFQFKQINFFAYYEALLIFLF
jgi:hypothetical protein